MTLSVRWLSIASSLVVIAVVSYYQLFSQQSAKVAGYTVQRTVKYSFNVRNPNNYPVEQSVLWIYAPVKESTFQQLASLTASHPFQTTKDNRGNERMEFIFDQLPPYGSRTVSVTATVNLSDQDNQIETTQTDRYLLDEERIGLKNSGIQRMAKNLKAENPRDTANRIYDWMTRNITKSNYTSDDLGAPIALSNRSGDCTEFMYLFSALARANGIPTRNMAGFVATENRVLRPADYHNWNEAYIDGEWHLIDTDKKVFMEKSDEYIAMRLIGNSTLNGSMNSQSFFSASGGIQVYMN